VCPGFKKGITRVGHWADTCDPRDEFRVPDWGVERAGLQETIILNEHELDKRDRPIRVFRLYITLSLHRFRYFNY